MASRYQTTLTVARASSYLLLGVLTLACVVPFYLMVISSTRTNNEIMAGVSFLPGNSLKANFDTLTLGLLDEAKKNGIVLGYNYPGDPWYGDAYKLLTSKGLRPAVEPKANGKRGFFHVPFTKDKRETIKPPAATAPPPATVAEKPAEPNKN